MSSAADTNDRATEDELQLSRRRQNRILLAAESDALYEHLLHGRKAARNCMWFSLFCLLGATCARVVDLFSEVPVAVQGLACIPVVIGACSMPITVLYFRRSYETLISRHVEQGETALWSISGRLF